MTNKENMLFYCGTQIKDFAKKDSDALRVRGELFLRVKGYIQDDNYEELAKIESFCPKDCASTIDEIDCAWATKKDNPCVECWRKAIKGDIGVNIEMDKKKDNVTKLGEVKKNTVQENGTDTYIKTLIGKRVGVTVYDNNRDIYGELDSLTYDNEGILEGIVLKEWGWLRWECVIRINEFRSKTER